MRAVLEEHLISVILAFIGTIFAVAAVALLWDGISTQQQIEIAQQIPLYAATELNDLAVETLVAVEGKISERNGSNSQGLVVYTKRQYDGTRCDDEHDECEEIWTLIESSIPALWLDMPDGRIRIGNTDYKLYNPPEISQSTEYLIEGETVEYQGYRIGDDIYTIGQINQDDGLSLNIEFIFGGTYEDYLVSQFQTEATLMLLGAIFGGIAILLLGIAIIASILARKNKIVNNEQ